MSAYGVPPEGSLGERLGLELHELIAANAPSEAALHLISGHVREMLRSDPSSIFDTVLPVTSGADGQLRISVSIREDFRRNLAVAARNDSFTFGCHEQAPTIRPKLPRPTPDSKST